MVQEKTKLMQIRCDEEFPSIFKEANYAESFYLEEIIATRIRRPPVRLDGPDLAHQKLQQQWNTLVKAAMK